MSPALCRILLFACSLFIAVGAHADCPPQAPPPELARYKSPPADGADRGLLWKLGKDGATSWLYGTLHVGRTAWAYPGAQVLRALRASDVVVFEIDFRKVSAAVLQGAASGDGAAPQPVLDATLKQRIRVRAERDCVPLPALEALHPALQVAGLTFAAVRRDGLHPELSADLVLTLTALAGGKEIAGLESPQMQVQLLTSGDADAQMRSIERTLAALEGGEATRMIGGLAAAWERGDEQAIEAILLATSATPEGGEQLRRFNDERNGPMADQLAALHRGGRTFFAAVGAAHMTGPRALPTLLRDRGFTVERVHFPQVNP